MVGDLPGISIIIVNYKSWVSLDDCLISITSQKTNLIEIIIIDNNSNDGQISLFKKKYNKCTWIINKKNIGFSKACNQGAKASKYDYYIFLNPDTILEPNSLTMLRENINIYPNSILSISQKDSKGVKKFPYGKFLSIKTFNGIMRFLVRLLSLKTEKDNNKPLLDQIARHFYQLTEKILIDLVGGMKIIGCTMKIWTCVKDQKYWNGNYINQLDNMYSSPWQITRVNLNNR